MWKSEYLTGIKFIDDQHMHLHALSKEIRESKKLNDKIKTFKMMDDFFYYLMFHFEYENKLMQSREYPMYGDHYMAHSSILSEVLSSFELATKDFEKGTNRLLKAVDTLYEKHLYQFDNDLSAFEKQNLPHSVKDYNFQANGQLIFFENGYIISAYGEVDEMLIAGFIEELRPLIKAHYAHKKNWTVITDFRRWKYITKDAVDLINNFVVESDHNSNIQRYYLIEQDNLSRYLVDQMLGTEMDQEIIVHDMYKILQSMGLNKRKMGQTLKTCNFGNLINIDIKELFG